MTILPEGEELKSTHDAVDSDDLTDVLMSPNIEMDTFEMEVRRPSPAVANPLPICAVGPGVGRVRSTTAPLVLRVVRSRS